jgi:glycosyltransferase involved in cell wall biosynthesis
LREALRNNQIDGRPFCRESGRFVISIPETFSVMQSNWSIGPGEKTLVSVIVTAYNQECFLAETLESVLGQSYRPIECVIVDDGSSDGTAKVAAGYVERSEPGMAFRHIHQENQGAQAARNNGVTACRGEYIQHLDGDDLLDKDKLGTQVEFLSKSGRDCEAAYGDGMFLLPGENGYQAAEKFGTGPSEDFVVTLLSGRFNANFSYLCRRSAVQTTGPWDPAIAINQDYEYFLRMACLGMRFQYVPGMTGFYRKHSRARISDQGMLLRGRTTLAILRSGEQIAEAAGLLTPPRRRAFAKSYRNVSCWMFGLDRPTWRSSLMDSLRVCPDFRPENFMQRMMQSVLGIWTTETVLGIARQLKQRLTI